MALVSEYLLSSFPPRQKKGPDAMNAIKGERKETTMTIEATSEFAISCKDAAPADPQSCQNLLDLLPVGQDPVTLGRQDSNLDVSLPLNIYSSKFSLQDFGYL